MRDRKIEIMTPAEAENKTLDKLLSEECYIIAAPGCGYVGEMAEKCRKCFESKDFILFQTESERGASDEAYHSDSLL